MQIRFCLLVFIENFFDSSYFYPMRRSLYLVGTVYEMIAAEADYEVSDLCSYSE